MIEDNNTDRFCEQLLHAKPSEEIDKSKIKWRKKRKFKVQWNPRRKSGYTRPQKNPHPGTDEARAVLERLGTNVTVCENCGSYERVAIHHIDRNPYNNRIENLKVLCSGCHYFEHHELEEEGVIADEENCV